MTLGSAWFTTARRRQNNKDSQPTKDSRRSQRQHTKDRTSFLTCVILTMLSSRPAVSGPLSKDL